MAFRASFHHLSGGAGATTLATLVACELHRRHPDQSVVLAATDASRRRALAMMGVPGASWAKFPFTVAPHFRLPDADVMHDEGEWWVDDMPTGHGPEASGLADVRVLVVRNDYADLAEMMRFDGPEGYDLVAVSGDHERSLTLADVEAVVGGLAKVEWVGRTGSVARRSDAGLVIGRKFGEAQRLLELLSPAGEERSFAHQAEGRAKRMARMQANRTEPLDEDE